MKLRVVGWTYYDEDLPCGDCGWAARNAIIDDIRAHGYAFSGWTHQEGRCGTPVLNDGKKYCYSQRGWGDVMAEAYEEKGMFSYSEFAFRMPHEKRPSAFLSESDDIAAESDLNEEFVLEVSPEDFDAASNGTLKVRDYSNLRYIYKGDVLTLTCGDKSARYAVLDASREKDATREQLQDLTYRIVYARLPEEERQRANREYEEIPLVLVISLENR